MSTPNTHYGAKAIEKLLDKSRCKRIFFCGVGGINMSSLAHLSILDGYAVVGSDRTESALTRALEAMGAEIHIGHCADNLSGCDAFVYTVAISPDNEEYVRAGEMGLPRISRADFLGYAMTRRPCRIGISGTHGKSTCTAMCHSVYAAANRDPVVMCGAEMVGASSGGSSCVIGQGDSFIFEACEYMDSFLDFNPTVAVVLNMEMDHVDYFKDMGQMRRSYLDFANITRKFGEGCVVYNRDCEQTVRALSAFEGRHITFGVESEGEGFVARELCEERGCYSFNAYLNGEFFASVKLSVPGKHNVYNALAAMAVGYVGGISPEDCARGVGEFKGTRRRMEYKGSLSGARVYDDYAHHPTEIRASLASARKFSDGRLICLFQSHTYSRTAALLDDFADALSEADIAMIAPIYSARETDTLGVDQYVLADAINSLHKKNDMGKMSFGCGNFDECRESLMREMRQGDTVIVMGAGDVCSIIPEMNLR